MFSTNTQRTNSYFSKRCCTLVCASSPCVRDSFCWTLRGICIKMDVISYENCLIIIVVLYGMGKLQFVVLTLIRGLWIPLVDFIHVEQYVNSAIRRSVKWDSANWTRTLCLQRSVPIKSMVNVQLCIAEIHTGVVGFPILAYPVNFCKFTIDCSTRVPLPISNEGLRQHGKWDSDTKNCGTLWCVPSYSGGRDCRVWNTWLFMSDSVRNTNCYIFGLV